MSNMTVNELEATLRAQQIWLRSHPTGTRALSIRRNVRAIERELEGRAA